MASMPIVSTSQIERVAYAHQTWEEVAVIHLMSRLFSGRHFPA